MASNVHSRACPWSEIHVSIVGNFFFSPYLYSRFPFKFLTKLLSGLPVNVKVNVNIQISPPIILKFSFSFSYYTDTILLIWFIEKITE